MWKLMIRVVNRAELRTLVGWFAFSAVLQGITLALMIPFLRALFSRSETPWHLARRRCHPRRDHGDGRHLRDVPLLSDQRL